MHDLKPFLEQVYERYHRVEYLRTDPLELVHRFTAPREREAVAFLSALLAYGNVKQIRASGENVLTRLEAWGEGSLTRALDRAAHSTEAAALTEALRGFGHRFNPARDWVLLIRLIAVSQARWGSVGHHFIRHLNPAARDFSVALDRFQKEWLEQVEEWDPGAVASGSSFRFLLNSPLQGGSCCKRWCMLLRWLGRRDEMDPGLWTPLGLRADQLVIPLDTHTGRLSQYLGLTSRKSLNWKAAREITDRLMELDPADPVRFDFSLCRLGILKQCKNRYVEEICGRCALNPACGMAARGRQRAIKSRRKR